MKKSILALVLVVGLFSSCGTTSKIPGANDLIMTTLKSALMKQDIGLLKPFLSNDFSVGSLLGQAAVSKAGELLQSGPKVTDLSLESAQKTGTGILMNTLLNVEGESEPQKSEVNLDSAGKISSIGFLTDLLTGSK